MRSVRIGLLLVVVLGVAFVGVEVARHMGGRVLPNPQVLLQLTPGAALHVKDFHRSMIEDGRKTWEVKGAEGAWFKSEERAVILRPELVFHHRDGRTLEAASPEGKVFLPGGRLGRAVLEGPVDVTYDNARFRADRLIYLHAEDRVVCPGKVWARVDGVEFEGEDMSYSLRDEVLEVRSAVRTTIPPRRPGPAKVAGG